MDGWEIEKQWRIRGRKVKGRSWGFYKRREQGRKLAEKGSDEGIILTCRIRKERSTRVTTNTKNTQKRVRAGWDGRRSTRAGQELESRTRIITGPTKANWSRDKETMGRKEDGVGPKLTTSYEKR
ncbi:hypothetical protein BY996DRAFT_6620120 [Phakopsora pachyrhizi]|nr:hypothetical protein BY996DRAFT_6620120 [Phakopsora pachyrhizi]